MHFGYTLQKIRKNRSLTQKDVCDGIMKQGTYSRIENGQLAIGAEELAQIVERLNISLNEFLYIHQNYKATPRQQLINDYVQIELTISSELKQKRKAVEQYLKRQSDLEIEMLLHSYDALIALAEQGDLATVRQLAEKIWLHLQKLDHWYLNDLELLNAIIIYFPLDIAIEVTKTAISRIEAYKHYDKEMSYLKLYFKVNLSTLYLEESRFEEGLDLLNDAHDQFNHILTYQMLGFILTRKITCKHFLNLSYKEDLQKLHMLQELFNHEEVFTVLFNELYINIPTLKDI